MINDFSTIGSNLASKIPKTNVRGCSPSRSCSLAQFYDGDENSVKLTKESIRQTRALIHTQEDVKDTLCGIGPFKPKWLQVLALKEVYVLCYCLVGLTQGMFFTYTVSTLSTIEKRFKLTSKQTGTILSGNDISQVILAMILGYYGNYGHRPRWLGFGVLCAAVSCFVAALPHFIYGPGQDAVDIVDATYTGLGNLVDNVTGVARKAKRTEVCFSGGSQDAACQDSGLPGESFLGPVILLSSHTASCFFSYSLCAIYVQGNKTARAVEESSLGAQTMAHWRL
nr:solute carrier organic anion transporter family member 4A1-like [Cherax quadricarinatus]